MTGAKIIISASALLMSVTPISTAVAQSDWSGYNVILYDAATVEAINKPAESVENYSTEIVIEDKETTKDVSVPMILPRDISHLVSEYNSINVPIIINPELCAKDDLAIRLEITGIKHKTGHIMADLHDEIPEDFLKRDKVILRLHIPVTEGTVYSCMPLTEPGQYAIGFYHDKNDNRKFDKGFLRMPKERFGMSNNPKYGRRQPDVSEALIDVPLTGTDISIKMVSAGDILKGQKD